MQEIYLTQDRSLYTSDMQVGRPAKEPRTEFGERLYALRLQLGLSQQELAAKLGLSQRAYAHWERNPVAIRPDQIVKLADTLQVPVEALFENNTAQRRGQGPAGRMRRLFEATSKLPRSQQQKIAAVLEAFVKVNVNNLGS